MRFEIVVSVAGFEPAASCPPDKRSNQTELHEEKLHYKTKAPILFKEPGLGGISIFKKLKKVFCITYSKLELEHKRLVSSGVTAGVATGVAKAAK